MTIPIQNKLLELAREKGFLTLKDTFLFYSSHFSRVNALKQLVAHGYLKRSSLPDRFEYVIG